MFCGHCGKQIPNEAAFCNYCGSRVTSDSLPPSEARGRVTVQFTNDAQISAPLSQEQQTPFPDMTLPSSSQSGVGWSPSQPLFPPPVTMYPSSSQSLPTYVQPSASLPAQPTRAWGTSQRLSQPIASTNAVQFLPPSGMQRLLIRVFQPQLASSPWLGITFGSLLAIIGGVACAALLLTIAHAIFPKEVHEALYATGEDRSNGLLGIVSLHSPFRDSLQLFLVMHGIGLHIQYSSSSGGFTYVYNSFSPLHGLLLVPALLLILGGYIAASTDFQSRLSTSLSRGAAIAIPYTILLLILMSQVNGTIPNVNGNDQSFSSMLSMDVPTLLLFGLLWGALFGLIGASLKFARGQWRHMIHTYLRTNRSSQLVGMIAGGLSATGLGLTLSLLTLYCFVAYTAYSSTLLTRAMCTTTDWQALTVWSVAQGPIHAISLFMLSFGAPITIINQATGQQTCFYTTTPHTTLSLLDPNMHTTPWLYALLLIPAICLFLGGRASVAASRVQGIGPAAIQGVLIAIPFTVLMILLSFISAITSTYTSSGGNVAGNTITQSLSVDVFTMLLWALLSGAVFGALGGMYQVSSLKRGVGTALAGLAFPVKIIFAPLYSLLDSISGQTNTLRRSSARTLLYTALISIIVLAIAAIVVGILLINMNQALTYDNNRRIRDICSVVVIALPGLLLLCAGTSALATDPFAYTQMFQQGTPISTLPMQRGV